MNSNQKISDKEDSIKQSRKQLEYLTNELNKTTEHIQLLEIHEESNTNETTEGYEIDELIRKQNIISNEIITVKKRIQTLSAKTILKAELLILPIVVVLLFYVVTSYSIQPIVDDSSLKTRYFVEDLGGSTTSNQAYWNIITDAPLIINIDNNAHVNNEKIDVIKKAILSTEVVNYDSSSLYHLVGTKSNYYKGWQGAIKNTSDEKHHMPQKFDIVQSSSGMGSIVITLSTLKDAEGFSGITRTMTDENHILKSFITIYEADKLTDNQLEAISKHEFGHALGLPNTSNSEDLMHDTIKATNTDISECDRNALEKLYDESLLPDDFCNSGK